MTDQESSAIKVKTPLKVLYFSDGEMEVFDEDEETKPEEIEPPVDETKLTWTPWLIYKAKRLGTNVLYGLDYSGEKLADLFGLSGPKYAYELNQYKKEQERKAKQEKEEKDNSWAIPAESPSLSEPITTPPKQ